jgi:acyl-CoA synthetase (AMP-forming)/AMP-acid ligase II
VNCATRVLPHLRERPDRQAIWTTRGAASFGDFGGLAARVQALARREGLRTGDAVLLLDTPGPLLFATMIGLLGLGITVVFVEPWLAVGDVEHVLRRAAPRAFIGSRLAQLWALRVGAARRIPRWIHIRDVARGGHRGPLECLDLDPATPATITFSSGTAGRPKGLVRSHACMWSLHEAITDADGGDRFEGPELCVFPNMALLHLGTGRGAVLVPKSWGRRSLRRVEALCREARPASMATGPAFLIRLLRYAEGREAFGSLRSIAVGGAQTDCWILERCFERWAGARFLHIYGGSEAEPVALADAREAVERSRGRGRFQTLFVGEPVPILETDPDPLRGLRVRGPNVAEAFRDAPAPDDGWHHVGDRIVADEEGWWYAGRAAQPPEEFELEQRLYADLGTSACFVHREPGGRLVLHGEDVVRRVAEAGPDFGRRHPELDGVRDAKIVRDRRHRARIDRRASLARAGRGRAGRGAGGAR